VGQTLPSEKTVCWWRSVLSVLKPSISGKLNGLPARCVCSCAVTCTERIKKTNRITGFIVVCLDQMYEILSKLKVKYSKACAHKGQTGPKSKKCERHSNVCFMSKKCSRH
jgi:hypothetical protein